jgi:hypothetical protein
MMYVKGNRSDGFAIPAAVMVIVVVSLLALSGLYVAQSNATANAGLRRSWKAFYAADAGAARVTTDWHQSAFRTLDPGDSVISDWRALANGSEYRTSVLRVDQGLDGEPQLFRLRTVGRPGPGFTAQRAVVSMVSVVRANGLCCDAAMKVQGNLRIQGVGAEVKVSGQDSVPTGWTGQCSASLTDVPGVRMQDEDDLQINGQPVLEGTPPVLEDTTIVSDDFTQFGDVSYWDMARMADKKFVGDQVLPTIQPSISDGACSTQVRTNWGDPLDPDGPCWDYLPIIHIAGQAHFSGTGYGQGILLIDGDLVVSGTFDFYGVVIVLGEADFRGTTDLHGGLLVRNGVSAGDQSWLRGGTSLQFSSCAAGRALGHAIAARPLDGRHWFEVLE